MQGRSDMAGGPRRGRRIVAAGAIVGALLLVASCASPGSTPGSAIPSAHRTASPTPTATTAPRPAPSHAAVVPVSGSNGPRGPALASTGVDAAATATAGVLGLLALVGGGLILTLRRRSERTGS